MIAPLAAAIAWSAQTIPIGVAQIQIEVDKTALDVYTYKPKSYKQGPIIVVFHGVNRNADEYRDHSVSMGDRFGALIVAPRFDSDRFPSRRYQLGGLLRSDGTPAAGEEWTWTMIPKICSRIRALEGRPRMPYFLIGHSAGGQFVMRMTGFVSAGAERIVSANPGSDLFPTREMKYPYGFGGLPDELSGDHVLKRYLAQPFTIYLGTGDVIQDANFDKSPSGLLQGASRWERGNRCFEMGRELARSKGWEFNWTLVEARAIPHDHEQMFNHPICEIALFGKYK